MFDNIFDEKCDNFFVSAQLIQHKKVTHLISPKRVV